MTISKRPVSNGKIRRADEPRLSYQKNVIAAREKDRLKQGDAIQEWSSRLNKDRLLEWYFRDGEVLAVVDKPCRGRYAPKWVALIQWHDGNYVTGWSALPQHEWIHKSAMLRRKPTAAKRQVGA